MLELCICQCMFKYVNSDANALLRILTAHRSHTAALQPQITNVLIFVNQTFNKVLDVCSLQH